MVFNLIDNLPLSALVVTCSLLPIPTNGRRSNSRRNYNDRVSFSCNTGYNLRGSSSRTCQSTGLWSGIQPTCDSKRRHIRLCHYSSIYTWMLILIHNNWMYWSSNTIVVLHCQMLCDQFYTTRGLAEWLAVVSLLTLTNNLQRLSGLKGVPNKNWSLNLTSS